MLRREQARKRIEFLLHEVEKFNEDARAPLRVSARPAPLRGLRIRNRPLDFGLARESDFCLDFSGIRIEYITTAARGRWHLFAADEMADLAHLSFLPWRARAVRFKCSR